MRGDRPFVFTNLHQELARQKILVRRFPTSTLELPAIVSIFGIRHPGHAFFARFCARSTGCRPVCNGNFVADVPAFETARPAP